jgi:hypothetical protein
VVVVWDLKFGAWDFIASGLALSFFEFGFLFFEICLGFGARHSEPVRQAGLGFGIPSARFEQPNSSPT